MAKIYSVEERKNYCAMWCRSGLNKSRFSQEQGISEAALRKWLKVYGCDEEKTELEFLEVETEPRAEMRSVEIKLPNGLIVRAEVKSVIGLIRELSA